MAKSRIKIPRDQKPKSTEDFFSNFADHAGESAAEFEHNKIKKYTRQTFMINSEQLEKLKDFVHTKRINGDSNYTQKQALETALELLFESIESIKSRPK